MKITVNGTLVLSAQAGDTLYSALIRGGVFVDAACGGGGRCGKCRVRLLSGSVKGAVPDRDGRILSCRAVLTEDISVEAVQGAKRVANETQCGGAAGGQDCGCAGFRTEVKRAGIALDIGTTTVCASLVDLDSGAVLKTSAQLNSQRVFGADVISRINAASDGKTELMHRAVVSDVAELLDGFKSRFSFDEIEKMTVAANATMLHLFLNVDPSPMGQIPFSPVFDDLRVLSGESIGLCEVRKVVVLPSFSAFVGADIAAGLAAVRILEQKSAALFIDIGTNGEIALFSNGRLFLCSTAAGPALEGAGISCGTGGVKGAVNGVSEDGGDIAVTLIDGSGGKIPLDNDTGLKPVGICGCGLIDAVALMRRINVIDETGATDDSPSRFKERLSGDGFYICEGVTITGRDVRQFQLAKGAIGAGINTLLKQAKTELKQIESLYIAGGLGFFIDKKNAVYTGLLPKADLEKMQVRGNLSLAGATLCLINDSETDYIMRLKECAVNVELASAEGFADEFADCMMF